MCPISDVLNGARVISVRGHRKRPVLVDTWGCMVLCVDLDVGPGAAVLKGPAGEQQLALAVGLAAVMVGELTGGNLAQALETSNFGFAPQLTNRPLLFRFAVAIVGRLLVPYAEQGRIQDVEVSSPNQFGKELEEKGKE